MTDKMWTKDETAVLERLVAEKYSARQIAAKVGRPRNSVIGKCYRSGFKLGGYASHILTKRQAECHRFICWFIRETGFPPQLHEIATALGYKPGASASSGLVDILIRKGYLRRSAFGHGELIVLKPLQAFKVNPKTLQLEGMT